MDQKLKASILGDGAEYYVASQIMLNLNYLVSIAPTSAPSWDIEATNPINMKSARIQVKYRTYSKNDSSALRLRNALDFDFLILVESPIMSEVTQNDCSRVIKGFNDSALHIYPTWIISKQLSSDLIYESPYKKNGFMIRNFRTAENLYNWDIIKEALS